MARDQVGVRALRGMEALRSAGLVREATRKLADLPPPIPLEPGHKTLGEILADQRERT